jgi:hypothetical protein
MTLRMIDGVAVNVVVVVLVEGGLGRAYIHPSCTGRV